MVKNLPSNAEYVGSILDQGSKIPHAMAQVNLCIAIFEPVHPNEKSHMTQWGSRVPELRPKAAK